MARKVYKYKVTVGKPLEVRVAAQYEVVHVGQMPTDGDENDTVSVWIEHEPDRTPNTTLTFDIFGTGHQIGDRYKHVGSVVTPIGLVWHVYMAWRFGA